MVNPGDCVVGEDLYGSRAVGVIDEVELGQVFRNIPIYLNDEISNYL